jgi:hypothetical protein
VHQGGRESEFLGQEPQTGKAERGSFQTPGAVVVHHEAEVFLDTGTRSGQGMGLFGLGPLLAHRHVGGQPPVDQGAGLLGRLLRARAAGQDVRALLGQQATAEEELVGGQVVVDQPLILGQGARAHPGMGRGDGEVDLIEPARPFDGPIPVRVRCVGAEHGRTEDARSH